MVWLLVGAQLLMLFAMIAVSAWGWKHVPTEARLRVRASATGIDWTINKNTALLMTPLVGALVVVATVRDSTNRETVALLGLAVSAIFLAAHWSSIRRAGR